MSPRQALAEDVVKVACWLLFLAFVVAGMRGDIGRVFDQELANDAAQQRRHLERLEQRQPGAVPRVVDAAEAR